MLVFTAAALIAGSVIEYGHADDRSGIAVVAAVVLVVLLFELAVRMGRR